MHISSFLIFIHLKRFGPGAVIYWFGFVKELSETDERGILLLDKFPSPAEILQLEDFHKDEAKTFGVDWFRKKEEEEWLKASHNDCELVDEDDDKFEDYIDPMFRSDDDDDDAHPSVNSDMLKTSPSSENFDSGLDQR